MKQLLFALALGLLTVSLAAQNVTRYQSGQEQWPDWRLNFDQLSHEERGALYTDPTVDQKYLQAHLASLRMERPQWRAGGNDDFSCDAWYDLNAELSATSINPDDWQQFDAGCGAGGAVDSYVGPIALPFTYCHFGTPFNEFYINTKGTITFDAPQCDWTPESVPGSGYNMIAGYWSDQDFTASGIVQYAIIDNNAAVITFDQVGYYASNSDKVNTYQIIISDGTSDIIGQGNNVGLIYQDMQWAHGDVGGNDGFGGPTPGTVGAENAANGEGIQIGRFNLDNDDYDGPFDNEDGVHWLDNKSFVFSTCEDPSDPGQGVAQNFPPISSTVIGGLNGVLPEIAGCDTLYLCTGEDLEFSVSYFAPEQNQNLLITVEDLDGILQNATWGGGEYTTVSGTITGSAANQGAHDITITVVDDGTPEGSLVQTFVISILEFEAPEIQILGETEFCGVDGTTLTVEPSNLDLYNWNHPNCQGNTPECQVVSDFLVQVEAFLGPCRSEASLQVNALDLFIPQTFPTNPSVCDGCVEVCPDPDDEWVEVTWEIWQDPPSNIDNSNAEICVEEPSNPDCVLLRPGYYRLIAENDEGCDGANIFQVTDESGVPPADDFDLTFCGELVPMEFLGIGDPEEGAFQIYMFTDAADEVWGDAFLEVQITDAQTGEVTTEIVSYDGVGGFYDWNTTIQSADEIQVTYVCGPDGIDCNHSFLFFNCGNGNTSSVAGDCATQNATTPPDGALSCGVIYEATSLCPVNPLFGTWEQTSCPEEGTFSTTNEFSTTFTPPGYGEYTLMFSDVNCGITRTYVVEYNDEPVIDLSSEVVDLCDGESAEVTAENNGVTDCSDAYNWTATSLSESTTTPPIYTTSGDQNEELQVESTGQYELWQFIATVTNGCGEAEDTVLVEVHPQFEISLEDETICDGGTVVLDPFEGLPDVSYAWTCSGDCDGFNPNDTSPNLTVSGSGTYSVVVTNECNTEVAQAAVLISPGWQSQWPDGFTITECYEDEIVYCTNNNSAIPDGYTWEWQFDGASLGSNECVTIDENGLLELIVNDPICNVQYSGEALTNITSAPNLVISPLPGDTLTLCPNEVESFSASPIFSGTVLWTLNGCLEDDVISTEPSAELVSDQFDVECLNEYQTLTFFYENSCGVQTAEWTVQASLCELLVPNVFTPGNDLMNQFFEIPGIEAFERTSLQVFNRWGGLVFEDDDYKNQWDGGDVEAGTYYYVVQLFDSSDTVLQDFAEYMTIIRDK